MHNSNNNNEMKGILYKINDIPSPCAVAAGPATRFESDACWLLFMNGDGWEKVAGRLSKEDPSNL